MRSHLKDSGRIRGAQHLLSVSLLIVVCSAQRARSPASSEHRPEYIHAYQNQNYGYRIRIPEGLHASGNSSPNPNHGVRIDLTASGTYMWVDASYTDDTSLRQAAQSVSSQWQTLCGRIAGLKRRRDALGGLTAEHLSFRCVGQVLPNIQIVLTLRAPPTQGEVVYQLGLASDPEHQKHEVKLLDKVRKSFEFVPPK